MKRKLTKEEEQLTKLGLDRNSKELKTLKENLDYNLDLIAKQKYLREHDDRWREFLRMQKDNEDKQVVEAINKEIANKEDLVKTAKLHLNEGVEIKTPIGTG